MKRIGLIVCLSALIVVMSTALCFAGTFTVSETTPVNGQTETSIDNLCVKLYLEGDTDFDSNIKGQKKDCFRVLDSKGKSIPLKVLYNEKEHVILALAYDEKTNSSSGIVEQNSDYTFTVSKDLKDNKGNTLSMAGQEVDKDGNLSITFTTQNTSRSSTVNFVMMAVMFGGIFFFSSRSMKKKQKEEEEAKNVKREKVNPYKEAKRTGKSVEEIIAREEKLKAKDEAKQQKKADARRKAEEAELEELRKSYYKVSGPRPISAAGSKVVSGKKDK